MFDVFEERYPRELEEFLKLKYPKMLWLLYIKQKRNVFAGPELVKHAQDETRFSVLQVSRAVLREIEIAKGRSFE